MNVAMSKTQKRVVKMLNLEAGDTYESAKRALEAAGYRGDATPVRKTWRDAAKMSDADLLAAIRESDEYRWNQVYPERPDRNPVRKLRQPGRRLTKAQWEKQARMGRGEIVKFKIYDHGQMANDDDFGPHAVVETIEAADLDAALGIFNDKYDSNDYSLAVATARNPVRKLRQPGRRLTKAQWEKQARMGRRGPRTGPRPVKRRKKAKQVLHGLVQLPGRKNPLPVLLTTIGSGIEGGAAGAAGVTLYDELAKKKRAKAMRTRKAKSKRIQKRINKKEASLYAGSPSKRRKANNPSRRRASKVTHAVAVRNKIVGMGTGAQMKKLQSGLRRAGLKAKLGVREK